MATVAIDNVGPIEHLDIEVPEDGGVVVLRGHNGAGKSLALEATRSLLGGKVKPSVADGAAKGKVAGFGARINVASRITRSGQLETSSLEGSFDLATLVDPGINDPAAADAKRIKALLSLLGLEADPSLFYELVEGEAGYLQLGIEQTNDVVLLAKRIKSKLESRARDQESIADKLAGEAAGMLKDLSEYPPEISRNVESLNAELEAAIREKAKLETQRQAAQDDAEARANAKAKLAELPVPQVTPITDLLRQWDEASAQAEQEVARSEETLRLAKEKHAEALVNRDKALAALASAKQRSEERTVYESVLSDSKTASEPSAEAEQQANESLSQCRDRISQATLALVADRKAAESNAKRKEAEAARDTADRFREAARSTDDVLSGAVAKLEVGLKVVAGRLCTETRRGDTPLSELSHGERWKIAIDLGVKRVGERGVLAIPQESWESLDPANRELVHDHARKRVVVILTAEAANGELRSEIL